MSRPTPERGTLAVVLSDDGGAGTVALADFGAWCAAHAGRRCAVWLAGGLTLPLCAEPGVGFADEAALGDWASRVQQHYGHAGSGAWACWRSGGTVGACQLQGLDAAALQAAAQVHGVKLLSMQPWWCAALAGACAADAALRRGEAELWVCEGRALTCVELRAGRLATVQQHWLAHADVDSLAAWAAERAPVAARLVGYGLAGVLPPALQARGSLHAEVPAGLPPQRGAVPDFLAAPRRQARALGWALAATGACVLALAVVDAQQAHADLGALQSAPPTVAAVPVNDAAADAARLRLAHPWLAVVAAAEAAVPQGGHWLGLEHQAGQRELRLTGVAASLPAALSVAEQVRRSPGLADATVARSRVDAERGVVFELVARLAP